VPFSNMATGVYAAEGDSSFVIFLLVIHEETNNFKDIIIKF